VVDASNPTVVHGWELGGGEYSGCDLRIGSYREASLWRAFENILCTPASRFPNRLVRYFFSRVETPYILSYLRAGLVSEGSFGVDEGTDGYELAAAVGAGGGQLGSNTWAGRSLTADHPCGTRVSPKGEARLRMPKKDRSRGSDTV
jgi:hypothetical protein